MTSRTVIRPAKRNVLRGLLDSDPLRSSSPLWSPPRSGWHVLQPPATVRRVSIENTSEYNIGIEVRGAGGGWTDLASAGGQSTTERHEVVDRGDVWIFRFTSQGRQAGELRISRADLQAARWTIQIPDATVQELKDRAHRCHHDRPRRRSRHSGLERALTTLLRCTVRIVERLLSRG